MAGAMLLRSSLRYLMHPDTAESLRLVPDPAYGEPDASPDPGPHGGTDHGGTDPGPHGESKYNAYGCHLSASKWY